MTYRAAFASIDGSYIDQHFGSARFFQVYDIDGNGYSFIETRKAEAKCRGNCEGGFDHLLKILNDCDAVFVSKIGQGAAEFMIGHGKRVFEAAGRMEEVIAQLVEKNLLEEGK
jgi:predicted Fe-Mo cluster-binding NifX family protein